MHKVGQDPDHSTCMYGYNARHNNTGVLPTVVHLSYHAPRGRCVRLCAQRRCGARDTGGAARGWLAIRAPEPLLHTSHSGIIQRSELHSGADPFRGAPPRAHSIKWEGSGIETTCASRIPNPRAQFSFCDPHIYSRGDPHPQVLRQAELRKA